MIKPGLAIMLGFSLSMDALAIAIAMVICTSLVVTPASVTRVAGAFGLSQALMPIAGWGLAGSSAAIIGAWDHWVAFALLAFVGGRMIHEGLRDSTECIFTKEPSRGLPLLVLALGTSIDALAVGVSYIALEVSPFSTSAVIGIVTFIIVIAGMLLAKTIGKRSGERMTAIGGIILIAIGVKILFTHLGG
ncbi:MAG: manganese efflux pump MntP family protein [Thermovirgaceae bacterium]|nr:manganese efflux pump MntP family protein [Thermovirgaceae bacterium]